MHLVFIFKHLHSLQSERTLAWTLFCFYTFLMHFSLRKCGRWCELSGKLMDTSVPDETDVSARRFVCDVKRFGFLSSSVFHVMSSSASPSEREPWDISCCARFHQTLYFPSLVHLMDEILWDSLNQSQVQHVWRPRRCFLSLCPALLGFRLRL